MDEDEKVQEQPEAETWVVWGSNWNFEERGLTIADLIRFGAKPSDDLRPVIWGQENQWRVRRAEIPLSDAQLRTLLDSDSRFQLKET